MDPYGSGSRASHATGPGYSNVTNHKPTKFCSSSRQGDNKADLTRLLQGFSELLWGQADSELESSPINY